MPPSSHRGPVARIAVWSSVHPWFALLIWATMIAATVSLSYVVGTQGASDSERITGESRHTAELADAAGYRDAATELVLVTGNVKPADAQQILTALSDTEHVESVAGPIPSDSGAALLYQVAIEGDPDTASDRIDPLRATVKALGGEFGRLAPVRIDTDTVEARASPKPPRVGLGEPEVVTQLLDRFLSRTACTDADD